jgi:alkylation response protein AidB-like acyl-CoA dehydrogenase
MQFGLSESQLILKNNARKFFATECPPAEVRRIMETETAYDEVLWDKMAEQGFTGITFPEQFNGLGLGKVELALLMEEMGRALVPGPFFSTVAVCGSLIDAAANSEQKHKFLTPICDGEARAAFAAWDREDTPVKASGATLTGEKLFVSDAAVADFLVVDVGGTLHIADAHDSGVTITPMPAMDLTRRLYAVKFEGVPAVKLPGDAGNALDLATMALSAEMVGGMQRVLDQTVEYAKTRKQFGKPIGQFQAVQHHCADMFLQIESARSAAYYAAWALEEDVPEASTAVSIAKMYSSDASRDIGNRGIQVHGGMGFTWENDLHLFYRRFKASETSFGDATHHRERIAKLVIDGASKKAEVG